MTYLPPTWCCPVQALYLHEVGFSDTQMGLLLYMTLVGDAGISLVVTVYADGFGRRRTLLLGCALKLLGAAVMALVHGPQFGLLALGMTVGVISPSGNEVGPSGDGGARITGTCHTPHFKSDRNLPPPQVGPFLALEQSMLSDQVPPAARTVTFAWWVYHACVCWRYHWRCIGSDYARHFQPPNAHVLCLSMLLI